MRAILPVVAAFLLAGCGLKDDLYLSEPQPEASAPEEISHDSAPDADDDDAPNS